MEDNFTQRAPLYQAVLLLSKRDKLRFHMPGHGGEGEELFASAKYDLTELSGADNLLSPSGAIAEAEGLLARAYGCDRAYMFTCGSTSCMHAALAYARSLACTRGNILYTGDMHYSFFSGLQLLGMRAEYVPEEGLEERLKRGATGLFFTSPNYMGEVNGGEEIVRLCKKYRVKSFADCAHGAHYVFSRLLPESLTSKADVSFVSMHKTTDVFGGGAVLCANGESAEEMHFYRSLVHTTSPSYLAMASIDFARAKLERYGEEIYGEIKRRICALTLPKGYERERTDDFSRLVINCNGDAEYVMLKLEKSGIYCEAAIGEKLVLIITSHNVNGLEKLASALEKITPKPLKRLPKLRLIGSGRTDGAVAICEIDKCAGKVSGADICLYPPGVPVIRRGDILDDRAVRFIKENASRLSPLAYGRVIVLE